MEKSVVTRETQTIYAHEGAVSGDQGGSSVEEASMPELEGYDISRTVGCGGMGVVYLAWERQLERFVALKILPAHLAGDADARERFTNEVRALSRIQHPNIVPIHAVGQYGGRPYFTMAYVLGEPLSSGLHAGPDAEESLLSFWFRRSDDGGKRANLAACVLVHAVADALDDLHRLRLCHRDIKPDNIVIDAQGRPMLVDFGLACETDADHLKNHENASGTLRYMAPEVLRSTDLAADARSDIYSLGLTLFEMLTLRPAFPQKDVGEMIDAIQRGDKPSPREIEPSVPAALDAVVRKATALYPSERFQSARGMREALRVAKSTFAGKADLSTLALGANLERALEEAAGPPAGERWRRILWLSLLAAGGTALFFAGKITAT